MNGSFMKRVSCVLLIFLLLSSGLSVYASPQSVTPSYQYTEDSEVLASPSVYEVKKAVQLSELALETYGTISDVFIDDEGILHLLDSENGFLIQLNKDLQLLGTMIFTENGDECRFTSAQGLFVRGTGDEKTYYIADATRECILVANAKGEVQLQMTRPESNLIPDSLVFAPQKVVVNNVGVVYTVIPQLYMGAVAFSAQGEFLGFYGSNQVEVTAKLLLDHFWKKLLNSEQKSKMAKYVPVEYSNLDIDKQNFIYTVTSANAGSGSDKEQVKKINAKGINIMESKEYGDLEYYYDNGVLVDTSFVDIVAMEEGTVAALDATYGRVFVYDDLGNQLGVFGGMGEYQGSFRLPVAVESYGRDIYVLDQAKKSLCCFAPTDYGELLLSAVRYTKKGQFEKAYEKWQQVLQRDTGCEMAYVGVGKLLMQEKKYAEAAEAFRLGQDREEYSKAFSYYRNELLLRHFWLVFLILCVLLGLVFVLGHRSKGRKDYDYGLKNRGVFAKVRYALFHPIDGMELLTETVSPAKQYIVAAIVAASWLLVSVISYHGTGFAFNTHDPDSFSIWGQVAQTILLMAAFVIANWFVCVMTDGGGKLCEIALVTSLGLIPFLMFRVLDLLLSNLLTIEESGFVWVIGAVFYIWAVTILLLGLQTIHEFSFGRNLFTVFCTLVGMVIMALLAILVWSLMQQVVSFVVSIANELATMLS